MRTKLLPAVLALALFAGCGGEGGTGPSNDDDDDNNTGPVRTLSMSVNGTATTATLVSGTWYNGQFVLGGTFPGGSLSINANNFPGPGTYALGAGNPSTAIAQWVDGTTGSYSSLLLGGSGTLTLTIAELGHMKGTFSFIGKSQSGTSGSVLSVNITNGAFEVKLQ